MAGPESLKDWLRDGFVKVSSVSGGRAKMNYLPEGRRADVAAGKIIRSGQDKYGYPIYQYADPDDERGRVKTQWNVESHNASEYGTVLVNDLVPGQNFIFPKSLYAVEDTLLLFTRDKPDATILDFFSGSGTTAHAVMRLNKQDGGRRRSISVTNNEVSAEEQKALIAKGLRPGDEEWEALGIANYVTKPRVKAAITGKTPAGDDIKGAYKFTDEFPMKDGFKANAKFFTLTYEDPLAIQLARGFSRIAPLLWLRAGQQGPVIDDLTDKGYGVSAYYGVIESLDYLDDFIAEVEDKRPDLIYIITDDRRQFQHVAGLLPSGIETVRLYESYLTNFEVNTGRYA